MFGTYGNSFGVSATGQVPRCSPRLDGQSLREITGSLLGSRKTAHGDITTDTEVILSFTTKLKTKVSERRNYNSCVVKDDDCGLLRRV